MILISWKNPLLKGRDAAIGCKLVFEAKNHNLAGQNLTRFF